MTLTNKEKFQSTHSFAASLFDLRDFNPRTPYGVRRQTSFEIFRVCSAKEGVFFSWFRIALYSTADEARREEERSREALANNLTCNVRQINKWVKSLKDKQLIRTGRRRNVHTKQWDNTVYSLKPLIDELLKVVGYEPIPVQESFEIEWDDEPQVLRYPWVENPAVQLLFYFLPFFSFLFTEKKYNIKIS